MLEAHAEQAPRAHVAPLQCAAGRVRRAAARARHAGLGGAVALVDGHQQRVAQERDDLGRGRRAAGERVHQAAAHVALAELAHHLLHRVATSGQAGVALAHRRLARSRGRGGGWRAWRARHSRRARASGVGAASMGSPASMGPGERWRRCGLCAGTGCWVAASEPGYQLECTLLETLIATVSFSSNLCRPNMLSKGVTCVAASFRQGHMQAPNKDTGQPPRHARHRRRARLLEGCLGMLVAVGRVLQL
jgi:hypothetical protein